MKQVAATRKPKGARADAAQPSRQTHGHTGGGGRLSPRLGMSLSNHAVLRIGGADSLPKLAIGPRHDALESEADRLAGIAGSMPVTSSPPGADGERLAKVGMDIGSGTFPIKAGQPPMSKTGIADVATPGDFTAPLSVSAVLRSMGEPLGQTVRGLMEPCFGEDFSEVRVHTNMTAQRSAEDVNAQAYTVGENIVFGPGKYAPGTRDGQRLLAHELTHVLQQRTAFSPCLRRVVELRPPGRGEASAFDRRQELIDRMNALSPGIEYRLEDRQIAYTVVDAAQATPFDRQMQGFIDRAEVVPLRLITSEGRAGSRATGFQTVLIDFFDAAYVDLDDLRASDDNSFQMNLIHLLTERFAVRNYARRIGTNFSDAEFQRAHAAGLQAETQYLRDTVGDPTIRFIFEESRADGTVEFGFRSNEGYRIFHVFLRSTRAVSGGRVFVLTRDNRRLSIDELIAERAAAAAPAGP